MSFITGLDKKGILNLEPRIIGYALSSDDIMHIFKELGGFWTYNYEAAKKGKIGYHAELKSGRCSDGFFYSKIVLQHDNICEIIANQLKLKLIDDFSYYKTKYVAGVPNGATKLGEYMAKILKAKNVELVKQDGKIQIKTELNPDTAYNPLLLVEDFCTRATGFKETVKDIKSKYPNCGIYARELVILNRGGMDEFFIFIKNNRLFFKIISLAECRINDWEPNDCPLCKMGSKRIKPKASEENWRILTKKEDKDV